ncbi:hypothetical protein PMAYCL1PPCAC_27849, partial [Pristionchus mayeri]
LMLVLSLLLLALLNAVQGRESIASPAAVDGVIPHDGTTAKMMDVVRETAECHSTIANERPICTLNDVDMNSVKITTKRVANRTIPAVEVRNGIMNEKNSYSI